MTLILKISYIDVHIDDKYWEQRCDSLHCHEERWGPVGLPPSASCNPWKPSCVLLPCAISTLMPERCSSVVNLVLGRSHSPYDVLHTAVDWQVLSPLAALTHLAVLTSCSCPQSWKLSNSPLSCDSSVAITLYPTLIVMGCESCL